MIGQGEPDAPLVRALVILVTGDALTSIIFRAWTREWTLTWVACVALVALVTTAANLSLCHLESAPSKGGTLGGGKRGME